MAARLAGYRKFFALVLVCSLATIAKGLGFLDETLATFLGAAFLTYVGGNVGEHFSRAKNPFPPLPHLVPRRGAQASPEPAPPPRRPAAAIRRQPDDMEPTAFDHSESTETMGLLDRLTSAGFDLEEVRLAIELVQPRRR
jgi:hypothetical protein